MNGYYKDNFRELLLNSYKKFTHFMLESDKNHEIEENFEDEAIIPPEYYEGHDLWFRLHGLK